LSKLLRFTSTSGNETTLQSYVDRFVDGQEEIYFLAGESLDHVKTSPLLEKLQDRGLEVLFLVDPIDEYVFTQLAKFDGKHKLTNIARGEKKAIVMIVFFKKKKKLLFCRGFDSSWREGQEERR
jgi:molecular chaperone HtpG